MLNKELLKEIELYCKENNINDLGLFCNDLLRKAFTVEKYGILQTHPKNVEKKNIGIEEKRIPLQPEKEIEVKKEQIYFNKKNLNDDYGAYD